MRRPWRSEVCSVQRFGDDAFEIGGIALDGGRQGIAAERAEADLAHLDLFAGLRLQTLVVDHQQLAVAQYGRAIGGEVERHDVELFAHDVAPDVLLGPIGEREDAHRFAGAEAAVQEAPHLRTLLSRVPAMAGSAEGENALLGTARLFVATRAAEGRIEAVLVERLLQGLRLQHVGVDRTARDRSG